VQRFSEEVRSDDPDLASSLRIEERKLEVGGLNNDPANVAGRRRSAGERFGS
jgi:hypothetical protein